MEYLVVQESKEDLKNDAKMLKEHWSQPDVLAPNGHIRDI